MEALPQVERLERRQSARRQQLDELDERVRWEGDLGGGAGGGGRALVKLEAAALKVQVLETPEPAVTCGIG